MKKVFASLTAFLAIAASLSDSRCFAGQKEAEAASAPGPGSFIVYGGKALQVAACDLSFASFVHSSSEKEVSFPEGGVPENALGAPDCRTRYDTGFYSLGCFGELVLAFDDAPITDGPGADLVILEVGDAAEPTELSVSGNGVDWLVVAKTSGGVEYVDLSGKISDGESFSLLKIRDLGERCYGRMSGADIDAVAAIKRPPPQVPPPLPLSERAAPAPEPERVVLSGEVLFESGKAELKAEGLSALGGLLEKIGQGRYSVVVEGHTDSTGSEEYNAKLSLARATSVVEFLTREGKLPTDSIHAEGFGELKPRGDNQTPQGRASNRRVELVLSPLNN